jgi:large subunit ribosomal protein L35Ae
LSQKIIGRITNYRIGIKSQTPNQCLIEFQGITTAGLAGKLVGQKVTWQGKNSIHVGKVMGTHGGNGMVKVKFNRGVPGQAIGTQVQLLTSV